MAWLVSDLAFARLAVALVLVACATVQLRAPAAWLVFLPALLPVADLGLWSGRLYVTEFDLLVLTVASVHFLQAPSGERFPAIDGRTTVLVLLVPVAFLPALWIGAYPLTSPSAGAFFNYLSPYNALRVAKGFAWALLLLPALRRQLAIDPARAVRLFTVGVALGAAITGGIVLWERGVAEAVFTANRYAVLDALLNFSSAYRATALFTELHTGGEAFDTYLVLAAALTTAGALVLDRPVLRAVCAAASLLGLYAVVATFSRGLYSGFAVAFGLMLLAGAAARWRTDESWRRPIGAATIALPVVAIAAAVAFRYGGYKASTIAIALVGASAALSHAWRQRSLWIALGASALILVPAALLMEQSFVASRYSQTDLTTARALAVACSIPAALVGALFGRAVGPGQRGRAMWTLMLLAVVAGIGIPASSGYFMTGRLAAIGADIGGRTAHWSEATDLLNGSLAERLFGAGIGTFPRKYFFGGLGKDGTESKASYRFGSDADGGWLEIGSGDFNLTQKVPVAPHRQYRFSLDIRSPQAPSVLSAKLCPKLILFSDRWTPECKEAVFRTARVGADWEPQTVEFDSGALGQKKLLTWPITLLLHNGAERATVQVRNIRLEEIGGTSGNLIANGDFASAGDRWIMISDFEHLAWHIKNLYLQLYFETGLLGLIAFTVAICLALMLCMRATMRGRLMAAGFASALVGFCVVGLVGSLFDNPRPAFLFWFVLFWTLHGRFGDHLGRRADR